MKTVTYEEFLKFKPCWLEDEEQTAKLEEIGKRKEYWTALDVLNLSEEEVSTEDKLWAALRSEFIEENILHEFACRCAEEALKLVENPDPRSVAAIEAKRKWLKGKISDEELDAIRAAARGTAWEAASNAAWHAARSAAWDVAETAARRAAWCAARSTARKHQIEILKELLLKS